MTMRFTLDGREVEAGPGETIWQVARREGTEIPHLCHRPEPGYRPDGNCRACVVEIEGERALAASCIRMPKPAMVVRTAGARAERARRLVMELLLADRPARDAAPDAQAPLWRWADRTGADPARFAPAHTHATPAPDRSHPAIAVRLDACIQCGLCQRACREVQGNDVIGLAGRGAGTAVVFDLDDPMGDSTCVACGECVQACPTGALLPAAVVDAAGVVAARPDRTVDSVCPYCGVGCQITYGIKDDRLLTVDGRAGPSNQGRLCVKGRFGFDYVHSPQRLTVPLIRRDGVPKGDTAIDPANPFTHFREATWEEAMARAAGGLSQIRDTVGGSALAGFGSAKGTNEEAYLFQKLVRTGFGTNNVDHCTRLCHASSVAALMEGIGSGSVTAPFMAAADADVIVVIGANPSENHPVAATFFKNAVARGAKLVVIDPRGTALDRFATEIVRFRPGRDVALLNAILHTIVEEGLWNSDFVAARTRDFAALADHVRAFPPEAMEAVCGVPAAQIRAVARLYATAGAAIVFWGMGVSQHIHGTDNARCLIALAMICGHVGRPGTGLHPLRGQNNVQGASDAGLIPMFLPDYARVEDTDARARMQDLWGAPIDPHRGLTVVEIMQAIGERRIRGLYVMGENPAMSDPDLVHAREALARLDHLVVQDIFLTETAAFADVVLPASAWPEKDGTVTNTNRQVQRGRAALPLPGQARRDLDILIDMARRLGLDWTYQTPRDVFAEMGRAMASFANIGWDRLSREGSVTTPCPAPDAPGHDIVFADRFPTGDGRARLVPADLVDPAELPDTDFPMVLTTGRQLEHWHTGTMTRRTEVLDALEPGPTAYVAPADLRRMGLSAGDRVRLTTRRGTIALDARADTRLPAGVVFVPFAYAEAAANVLTNPRLDPDGRIPEFKYAAVRMEPA
jgi:formate dehydrogenase major subunit